jgi:delta-aminolevulinic acid dehydratase/porphobilinogen synthase
MKAKDFVLSKYPNAGYFPMIDNRRRQTSYVICNMDGSGEFIINNGARTASKAWTDAKKAILENKD